MIENAAKGLDIDFKSTYFIGDSWRDIEAGKNMGCRTVFLLTGKEKKDDIKSWTVKPDCVKNDLKEAVEWVLKQGQR